MYQLDKHDLWYDESIVAIDEEPILSLPPISKFLDKEFVVKHNQGYLVLGHHSFVYYWRKIFGGSEFTLRFSSAIFGILTILTLYVLTKRLFNLKIARISSFLLAISPFHVYYSQQLASYVFVALLALLAFYFFFKAVTTNAVKYWVFYLISISLSIYFHYMSLLLLASFLFFIILKWKVPKKILIYGLLTHLIIFLSIIPCLLIIFPLVQYLFTNNIQSAFTEFPCWVDKITWRNIFFTFRDFSIGYNVDFYSFFGIISTSLYLSLFLLGIYKDFRNYKTQFILIGVIFPITTLFLISQIKPCYVNRYFFFSLPLFLIGVAIGLSQMGKKAVFVLLTGIVFLNFIGLNNYYSDVLTPDYNQHIGVAEKLNGVDKLTRFIYRKFVKGDRILHTSKKTVFPLKFYATRDYDNTDLAKEVNRGSTFCISDNKTDLLYFDYESTYPRIVDVEKKKKLEKNSRVWLILSSFTPREVSKENFLEYQLVNLVNNSYIMKWYKEFNDIRLYLFEEKE